MSAKKQRGFRNLGVDYIRSRGGMTRGVDDYSFNPDHVSHHTLEKWRQSGELGQLLIGIKMGYSFAEVAAKREWDRITQLAIARELREFISKRERRNAERG